MRATLRLLRREGDAAPTAPAFALAALPSPLDHARAGGPDMDVQLDDAAVPSAIGGAAFWIVQEALTNVLRHADAWSAHVRVVKLGARDRVQLVVIAYQSGIADM